MCLKNWYAQDIGKWEQICGRGRGSDSRKGSKTGEEKTAMGEKRLREEETIIEGGNGGRRKETLMMARVPFSGLYGLNPCKSHSTVSTSYEIC